MELISTYFNEQTHKSRAEVHKNNSLYEVHYYNNSGELFRTENFDNERTAQNIAESWVLQIQVLKE
jgi:hypothetical protein